MTGGIMPRLSAIRWPIGVFVALLLVAGLAFLIGSLPAWRTSPLSAIAAVFASDEYRSERQELQFYAAALHRIEVEMRQEGDSPVAPSLRVEQEAVQQRLREVAGRLPADLMPADIRSLIAPKPAPAPDPTLTSGAVVRPVEPAAPVSGGGELRVGLRPPAPTAGLAVDAPRSLPAALDRPPARGITTNPLAATVDRAERRPPSR
jgi:hypothetical protein